MIKQFQPGLAAIALIAATALSALPAKAQQKSEIALSRQPGIFYMPSHIMEKQKLIEKHAAALGVHQEHRTQVPAPFEGIEDRPVVGLPPFGRIDHEFLEGGATQLDH